MHKRSLLLLLWVVACGEEDADPGSAGGASGAGTGGKAAAGRGGTSGRGAGGASGGGQAGAERAGRDASGGSAGAGRANGGAQTGGRAGSTGGVAGSGGRGDVSGGVGGTQSSGDGGQEQGGEAGSEGGNDAAGGAAAGEEGGGTAGSGAAAGSATAGSSGSAGSSGTGGAPATYTLSVSIEGTGTGVVTSSPPGLSCDSNACSGTFPWETVTLSFDADPGSAQAGSLGCDTVLGNDCVVELNRDRSVTVRFQHCDPVAPGDVHYVDAFSGTDDPALGGGENYCAYKSISYALNHASGEIRVAWGNYDTQEAFPLVLVGTQRIVCAPGQTASVIGATENSGSVLAYITGTENAVENCRFDMRTFPGVSLYVDSSGNHSVSDVHFVNGNTGAYVAPSVDSVEFSYCTFENTLSGISWGENSRGHMVLNTSSGNVNGSVRCRESAGSDAITGYMNTLESCVTCSGCPFD